MTRRSILALTGALALGGGWLAIDRLSSTTHHQVTLKLARTMSPMNLLFQIARKQDFWSPNGIIIQETVFASARQAMDAIISNSVDLSTVADTPLLLALHQGHKLKLECTLATSKRHLGIVLTDPQSTATCQGLKDRRIALAVGTTQEFFFEHLIGSPAANCGITVVNLQPVEALAAFKKGGDLAGIVAWEPQLSKALQVEGTKLDQGNGSYEHVFALAYGPGSRAMDPKIGYRIHAALSASVEWEKTHPSEVQHMLASSQQVGLDRAEQLRLAYSFSLDDIDKLIASLTQQESWALQRKYIQSTYGPDVLRRMLTE